MWFSFLPPHSVQLVSPANPHLEHLRTERPFPGLRRSELEFVHSPVSQTKALAHGAKFNSNKGISNSLRYNDLRRNVENIRKPFYLASFFVSISPVAVNIQSEKYLTHCVSRGQFISPLPLPLPLLFFPVTADFRIRMNNGALLYQVWAPY